MRYVGDTPASPRNPRRPQTRSVFRRLPVRRPAENAESLYLTAEHAETAEAIKNGLLCVLGALRGEKIMRATRWRSDLWVITTLLAVENRDVVV